jgi:hypothetical protein
MEKVIFDTNILRNTEPKTFLGGRDELKKFSKVSEIIFSDIVIEELKYQKRKQLEKHKKSFLDNPFHWLININQQVTENFDNESHITELEKNEDIKYSVIKLQDHTVLEQMKELALKKLPPFEKDEGSDKGFKDAYIYFTILEYLQTISDKYIFVCTKDGRFKEALQSHPNIKVIKDFEEFRKESISSVCDDYFIDKLKESVNINITATNIIDFWLSTSGNQILLIDTEDEKFVVEVEQREIVFHLKYSLIQNNIEDLILSDSWANTHSKCRFLLNYVKYIIPSDSEKLFEALIINDQIYGTYAYNVKEFYKDLFKASHFVLNSDDIEKLKTRFKLEENSN